jgi:hypothetical protein
MVLNCEMPETITVRIEGKDYSVEDREYTGAELKKIGAIPPSANLVQEETDGSEKGIRDEERVRPRHGQNFYHSPKHKRG